MKYSRTKLNNVGRILAAYDSPILDLAEAVTIVDDWRKTHALPLEDLVDQVKDVLKKADIPVSFSSQRLKRMTSIVDKLRRIPKMELGRMQDIGGARFVFDDIESLIKAKEVIAAASFDGFTLYGDVDDYVTNPKESGYRSIHFVYKYNSEDKNFDGLSVELQIRTRLQHNWATAVETAELISHSLLKASQGDENWLEFFKLVSAIFAKEEHMPVETKFSEYTEEDFCKDYASLNGKHKFLEQLKALAVSVNFAHEHAIDQGYVVLLIQFDVKQVSIKHFTAGQLDDANKMYAQVESTIDKSHNAAVLVSVSDMNELLEAYPSYFLNASEFIHALQKFNHDCRVKGYI